MFIVDSQIKDKITKTIASLDDDQICKTNQSYNKGTNKYASKNFNWLDHKKKQKKSENLVKTEKDSCVTLKEFFCPFCDLIGL